MMTSATLVLFFQIRKADGVTDKFDTTARYVNDEQILAVNTSIELSAATISAAKQTRTALRSW